MRHAGIRKILQEREETTEKSIRRKLRITHSQKQCKQEKRLRMRGREKIDMRDAGIRKIVQEKEETAEKEQKGELTITHMHKNRKNC